MKESGLNVKLFWGNLSSKNLWCFRSVVLFFDFLSKSQSGRTVVHVICLLRHSSKYVFFTRHKGLGTLWCLNQTRSSLYGRRGRSELKSKSIPQADRSRNENFSELYRAPECRSDNKWVILGRLTSDMNQIVELWYIFPKISHERLKLSIEQGDSTYFTAVFEWVYLTCN